MSIPDPESNGPGNFEREKARAEAVRNDLHELLEVDVSYDGWEHGTADKKAFYVRGFTWFRDHIIKNKLKITAAGDFIPQMKAIVKARPAWYSKPYNWDEDFGVRQFVDAASPHRNLTPKFHKGAEIIALCEAIASHFHKADASNLPPETVYTHMRIEPAVSFIHGFDVPMLDKINEQPGFLRNLATATGQKSLDVFRHMAEGRTVTHKLARRTHHYLTHRHQLQLGEIDFKYHSKRNYVPSNEEEIDVKDRDLPKEMRGPDAP